MSQHGEPCEEPSGKPERGELEWTKFGSIGSETDLLAALNSLSLRKEPGGQYQVTEKIHGCNFAIRQSRGIRTRTRR